MGGWPRLVQAFDVDTYTEENVADIFANVHFNEFTMYAGDVGKFDIKVYVRDESSEEGYLHYEDGSLVEGIIEHARFAPDIVTMMHFPFRDFTASEITKRIKIADKFTEEIKVSHPGS